VPQSNADFTNARSFASVPPWCEYLGTTFLLSVSYRYWCYEVAYKLMYYVLALDQNSSPVVLYNAVLTAEVV
jgi:hypothetical protein